MKGGTSHMRSRDDASPPPASAEWRDIRSANSIHELLSRVWSHDSDRIAVTEIPTGDPDDGDIRLTRGQLLDRVNRAANLFASAGIGPEDAVATLLPSGIDALTVLYGAQAAGIAAPLNPLLGIAELEHLLTLSGARVLVASSDPSIGVWTTAQELARRLPRLRLFSVGPPTPDAVDFGTACTQQGGARLGFDRLVRPVDIACYVHTGGTTGMPKLACISHDSFLYGGWVQSRCWGFGATDVILSALPLFHISGLATLGNVPLSVGAEVVFLSPTGFRNPKIVANFWRIVERYRGSFSAFVPTIAATLSSVPTDGRDLSSLRTIMTGGAAPPVDTLARLRAHVAADIVVTFGQTECIVGTGNRPGEAIDPRSSGKPLPGMRLAIRDLASGRDLGPGKPGEILLSGPAAFNGYRGRPAGEGRTADGWVLTGDVGWIDDDGVLFVTGRSKDLIIRSGHNIDPRSIEEAGASHPAVASCAAVSAPDRYAGELPVLYVTLRDGTEATADEIREWVSARVPERPAAPKTVRILPSLPSTAVGKIYKPALRLDAAEFVARRELADLIADGSVASVTARSDDRLGIVLDILPNIRWSPDDLKSRVEERLAGLLVHPRLITPAATDPTGS